MEKKMKIKIETDYNRTAQKEVSIEANISNSQVKKIVLDFFYNMDYYERRDWLLKNMKKEHIKEIA